MYTRAGIIILSFILLFSTSSIAASDSSADKEIRNMLTELFTVRSRYLAHDNIDLKQYYDQHLSSSRHAYHMEVNRKTYLNAWAQQRNIYIMDSQSKIRITKIRINGDTAHISLRHSQEIAYGYTDKMMSKQWFGIGTWHAITLKKVNNTWTLFKEWYLDPLEENPSAIPAGVISPSPYKKIVKDGERYKRQSAVNYANKYAGVALGAGKRGRYNPKYKNYNNLGGDCTNFASQAIGDKAEGGSLPMTGNWKYYNSSGGSRTWVQTDAFKNFVLQSGYGSMIAKDYFPELTKKTKAHSYGALAELVPGDLIGHILDNDVDHFSIVTGFDEQGYPLVNSHTADRLQVPFDLGWDNTTKYILIHMRD